MLITRLDGVEVKWSPLTNETKKKRSKLQEKAIEVIKSIVPSTMILEEVAIPINQKKQLYLDIFLPKHRISIEIQGAQHSHRNKFFQTKHQYNTQLENDRLKQEFCSLNNIPLIYFNYDEDIDVWANKLKIFLGITQPNGLN